MDVIVSNLTNYNLTNTTLSISNATYYNQSDNVNCMLNGVSSISPIFYNTTFYADPTFDATAVGIINSVPLLAYTDEKNFNGYIWGRRIDLNFMPRCGNEVNALNGMTRCVLQCLLFAGKIINNPSTTSTSFNLKSNPNPTFQSLKVYNNPLTNYDVVNKAYLTSYTSKYYKALTSTDFYIYVDLTKAHQFMLYFAATS